MVTEEQAVRFAEEGQHIKCDDDLFEYLRQHEKEADFEARLEFTLNDILDVVSRQYVKYTDEILQESPDIKTYLGVCKFTRDGEYPYYRAVKAYFEGNNDECLKLLKIDAEGLFSDIQAGGFTDQEFAVNYIVPFKNAFPGFWTAILEIMSSVNCQPGVLELCKAMPTVYESDSNEEIRVCLEAVLDSNTEATIVKEFLAYTYYELEMWGNAVAMFEQLEEYYVFFADDVFFMMAWCYGKLGELSQEIEYYEKSYEVFPNGFSTLNNLGYAYYKAKQYNKALAAFKECIENNLCLKYATNNYVRTLLAMKRFKDAKAFAKNPPAKIAKAYLDKINKAENTNQRIKADQPLEEAAEEIVNEPAVENKSIDIGVKKHQFSSEKLLEDELTMRIEQGMEVFGKKLKIYRKKGVYGRQFILSNGRRLDLLCEDDKGELYVIELKKDSGYDDAYAQTADYLDWFEKNWKDHKIVWGIICLNDPSQDLLDKVHADKRMKVYEYQISYTER